MFSLLAAAMTMSASAQTNFREITYKDALAAAKAENKMVFIDFYTEWCGPCKMMAREIFPQKSVGDFMNERFVSIKIDAEKGEGVTISKKYNVKAYPTFVILNPDETEVGRTEGSRTASAFVAEIDRISNPEKTPEKIKARYDSGERTAELVKDYAALCAEENRGKRMTREESIKAYDEGINIVQDYYKNLSDADRMKDENMFVYREYSPYTDLASTQFMAANKDKFPAENKAEIDSILRRTYETQTYLYLSGDREYDDAKISDLKNEISKLGFNSDKAYDGALKILSTPSADADKYIDVCKKYYNSLSEMNKSGVVQGMSAKYADADSDTKKKASRFIRNLLPDMSISELYSSIMGLMTLEGQSH